MRYETLGKAEHCNLDNVVDILIQFFRTGPTN
jgi:hypothetical protein